MVQDSIKCPKCGETIKLSQAISGDIEREISKRYEEMAIGREKELREKLKREMRDGMMSEIKDLRSQIEEKAKLLDEAGRQELDLRKRQRELEERERSMRLEMERVLDSERRKIAEKVSVDLEESHRLKDAQKEKQLADMRRQIEDLKRRSEQGSQKMQGEILELELEEALRKEFPFDAIDPIAPGTKGGDILQTVKTQSGRDCGKILWETKRTKNWSDSWIQKLKNDQRDVKADMAVLVSEALPEGLRQFREISGVWVTDISSALSLSLALRVVLNQVARERALQCGKKEKAEMIYDYLTGTEFKNRIEGIVEAFKLMKEDLDTERRSMERVWSKREKQIQQVILNIAGMHGDLEGLAGPSLPAVRSLELPESSG